MSELKTASPYTKAISDFCDQAGLAGISEAEFDRIFAELPGAPALFTDEEGCPCPFEDDPPSYERIASHYNGYGQQAKLFFQLYRDLEVEILGYLADQIAERNPRVVFDAGCGEGFQIVCLAKIFPLVDFVGTDLAYEAIRRVRFWRQSLSIPNCPLFTVNHVDLVENKAGHGFDLIYCKSAVDSGPFWIPDFLAAASPQLARQDFMGSAPFILRWQKHLGCLERILKADGKFLYLASMDADQIDIIEQMAWEVGLELVGEAHTFSTQPVKLDAPLVCLKFKKK